MSVTALGPIRSYNQRVLVVKRPKREADHTFQSNVEVNNTRGYNSTTPTHLQLVQWVDFYLCTNYPTSSSTVMPDKLTVVSWTFTRTFPIVTSIQKQTLHYWFPSSDSFDLRLRQAAFLKPVFVFRRVRKVAKGEYYLRHICLSLRPRKTNRLPLDRFSRNLIYVYF